MSKIHYREGVSRYDHMLCGCEGFAKNTRKRDLVTCTECTQQFVRYDAERQKRMDAHTELRAALVWRMTMYMLQRINGATYHQISDKLTSQRNKQLVRQALRRLLYRVGQLYRSRFLFRMCPHTTRLIAAGALPEHPSEYQRVLTSLVFHPNYTGERIYPEEENS